jgi:hypothetical protein
MPLRPARAARVMGAAMVLLAAVVLRTEPVLAQDQPAEAESGEGEDVDERAPPALPRPGPYLPFSGGASAGAPALPGETLVIPRSSAYLPSSLPLPERLGGGRGVRVGSFALQSVTSTGLAYDDNINASNKDRESDFIWSVQQGVRAQSLFRRHSLGFQASAGTGQYVKNRGESEINWLVGTDGRLDFTPRSNLSAFLTYTRDTESPEEPGASADADDNVFHLFNGGLAYSHQFRRISWTTAANAGRVEYENGDDGGRDSWSYGASTSVGYEVNDRLSVSLTPAYSRTTYDETTDSTGADQDSYGYSISAGAGYEVGPRLSATGSVGYSWQFGDDETQGVIFNGGLSYVIDGNTSATVTAFRSISDTDVDGASAEVSTGAALSLTRALGRRMAVGASVGASRNEFEGIDSKNDQIFATLGYGYAFTDSLTFSAGYRYTQQFGDGNDSSGSQQGLDDYYRNVFFIGLTLRL